MEKEEETFNLESIKDLIQSEKYKLFVTNLTNQLKTITVGGYSKTKRKTFKRKTIIKRKTTKRKTITGGANNFFETNKKYLIILILISLSLPFYLVPKFFDIIFTSTEQQLSQYIYEPFSLIFPSQLQNTIGATIVSSTIAYTQKTIVKNYYKKFIYLLSRSTVQ